MLHKIDRLEKEYRADQSIHLYTRDDWFYYGMNRSLRHGDINEIFSFRIVIRDLHEQLRKVRTTQIYDGQLIVYRGQQMHMDYIERLRQSIGKLICMNTFVSASLERAVALLFVEVGCKAPPAPQTTLFTISIDPSTIDITADDISILSEFADEQEYLFSLRCMFRVQEVSLIDGIWHIHLVAVDEDDQEFRTVVDPWKASIGAQSFFSTRDEPRYSRYLNVDNGSFLCFQLLLDIMLRLNRTDFAREEMIEMCNEQYADHPNDRKNVDRFEQSYRYEDAIRWYTADSFLCRLLHRSIRMENVNHIFKLRYYIHDLHNQLAEQHHSYVQSLPQDQSILTLYRGERMKLTELNALRQNVGQLISMNSFLSTTDDCVAAVFFAGDGALDQPGVEVSVLYQITIDITIPHSIPFARIQSQSIYEAEAEVLFSMASVFRIDGVEQYGSLWVVDLTLISKEDEEWNTLTAHLNK